MGRARLQGQPWGATMGLQPRGPRLDSNHGWGEQWRREGDMPPGQLGRAQEGHWVGSGS